MKQITLWDYYLENFSFSLEQRFLERAGVMTSVGGRRSHENIS